VHRDELSWRFVARVFGRFESQDLLFIKRQSVTDVALYAAERHIQSRERDHPLSIGHDLFTAIVSAHFARHVRNNAPAVTTHSHPLDGNLLTALQFPPDEALVYLLTASGLVVGH
jgi:hypothetical protein